MHEESPSNSSDGRKSKRLARRPAEERIAEGRERRGVERERPSRPRHPRTMVPRAKAVTGKPSMLGALIDGAQLESVASRDREPTAYWMSKRDWFAAGFLMVATLALYWPAVRCDFVKWDDNIYASENDQVTSGLRPCNFAWAFSTTDGSNWHPLTWLSLQLDATVFGPGPLGFHFDNIAQHALNAAILF